MNRKLSPHLIYTSFHIRSQDECNCMLQSSCHALLFHLRLPFFQPSLAVAENSCGETCLAGKKIGASCIQDKGISPSQTRSFTLHAEPGEFAVKVMIFLVCWLDPCKPNRKLQEFWWGAEEALHFATETNMWTTCFRLTQCGLGSKCFWKSCGSLATLKSCSFLRSVSSTLLSSQSFYSHSPPPPPPPPPPPRAGLKFGFAWCFFHSRIACCWLSFGCCFPGCSRLSHLGPWSAPPTHAWQQWEPCHVFWYGQFGRSQGGPAGAGAGGAQPISWSQKFTEPGNFSQNSCWFTMPNKWEPNAMIIMTTMFSAYYHPCGMVPFLHLTPCKQSWRSCTAVSVNAQTNSLFRAPESSWQMCNLFWGMKPL